MISSPEKHYCCIAEVSPCNAEEEAHTDHSRSVLPSNMGDLLYPPIQIESYITAF